MEHNKVVFESKVSEIFESPEIKAIEIEILNLYYEINRRWEANERNKFAITRLLKIRKKLLDSKFVMDDYSKQLLSEFNEAMKQQLIIMRSRTEELYHWNIHHIWESRENASWDIPIPHFTPSKRQGQRKCGRYLMVH